MALRLQVRSFASATLIGVSLLKPERMSGMRSENGGEEPSGSNRANLVALIAVVVIAALGYWAFTAIERQREIARCLDEGRRNCLDMGHPAALNADLGR